MARDITVTFEDGTTHVYRGAPDDVTPDQVSQRAAQEFGKGVSSLDGGRKPSIGDKVAQQAGNVLGGVVRGAGSIGATILSPLDAAARALNSGKPVNIGGIDVLGQDRRAGMDAALQTMGADPKSLAFQGGKLGAEIAGTAGVGGAAANLLGRVPGVATAAPNVLNAIRSAGMTGGTMPARMAGGAITGGLSVGAVDPGDALTGAVVGGAAPPVLKGAGAIGSKIGQMIRGPQQSADLVSAIQAARQAGYVIPPTQASPTLGNRLLEGFSGKITTAQNASAKNAQVTADLVAQEIGLPAGAKITPQALDGIRKQAGQAYQAVSSTGQVTPGRAYESALDAITQPFKTAAAGFPNAKPSPVIGEIESLKSPTFDASAAVEKIKELRDMADVAFRAGDKSIGKAYRAASSALEDVLDNHLQAIGAPASTLDAFREARQTIAKTYTVQKALNPTTGSLDAKKLAAELNRGKPLSGGIRTAADFANRFPKASQTVEGMGSLPQTSPLDWIGAGTLSGLAGNPLVMLSAMARPGARAVALSPVVQNRLIQSQGQNALARLIGSPTAEQLAYRGVPLIAADR